MHIREQVMAAMVNTLTGLTTTGTNVIRGRVYSIDDTELPHLSIYQGDDGVINPDGVDEATTIYLWNQFELVIEIHNEGSGGVLETELNLICKEIVIALMADPTQGGLCVNTIEISTGKPELSAAREKRTAITEMLFNVLYKRLRADPSST